MIHQYSLNGDESSRISILIPLDQVLGRLCRPDSWHDRHNLRAADFDSFGSKRKQSLRYFENGVYLIVLFFFLS